MAVSKITFNQNGATTSGTTTLYAKCPYGLTPGSYWYTGFFTSSSCSSSSEVFSIPSLPKKSGWKFKGYYTASSGGTQIFPSSGSVLDASKLTINSARTYYAQWDKLSYCLTLDKASGSGGTGSLYYKIGTGGGGWYSDINCTSEIMAVSVPSRSGYVFCGYYSAAGGVGTKYINEDGSFTDDFVLLDISSDTTIYAHWKRAYTLTVDADGGTGGDPCFYYIPDNAKFYSSLSPLTETTTVAVPQKSGMVSTGIYETQDPSAVCVVAVDGSISQSWTPSADSTVYARYRAIYTVTCVKDGGSGGMDSFIYDTSDRKFHPTSGVGDLTSIDMPVKKCYRLLGYFSSASGGTKYVNEDGSFTSSFTSLSVSGDIDIYARWQFLSYELTLDPAGGETTVESVFCDGSNNVYYDDDQLNNQISTVAVPERIGYGFDGYFREGVRVISPLGLIEISSPITQNLTATASWTIGTFTLNFDYRGGSGVSSKSVTYGQQIGNLPSPTKSRADFGGWYVDGTQISSSTVWTWGSNRTAVAEWITDVGYVEDFFGLKCDALIPIYSEDGRGKKKTITSHFGPIDLIETSGPWLNPTVTYRVVEDKMISVLLGKAFPGRSGSTGYMIVEAEVQTEIGNFPTLRVSAVANEGANAINTFLLTVNVSGNAHAQNLMSAVSGGGELKSCSLVAKCDPVVCEEYGMPCASDVVRGMLTVKASTVSANKEAAPTAANGFVLFDYPKILEDSRFPSYDFIAGKDM